MIDFLNSQILFNFFKYWIYINFKFEEDVFIYIIKQRTGRLFKQNNKKFMLLFCQIKQMIFMRHLVNSIKA